MPETITAIDPLELPHDYDAHRWSDEAGFRVTTTEQQIDLLITDEQSCCESWGYFLTEDDTTKFIGAELRGVRITDTNRSTKQFAPSFDGDYDNPDKVWLSDGDVMFVDIETDRGILQFVAYNAHNGYYGHTARVSSRQLVEERVL